jgi:hypothetical protein
MPVPTPSPAPTPTPVPIKVTPPTATFVVSTKARSVDAKRKALLVTLRCPAGGTACAVTAPTRVTVKIGGKSYKVTVLAGTSIKAGRSLSIRVQLSKAAYKRLRGRTASVKLKLTVTAPGGTTTRTVKVTIRR